MNSIKNILVALDLSSMDKYLIRYASFIAEHLEVENVYFVHNIKKYEISTLFEEQLKDINLDDVIGDELKEVIEEHFTAPVDWEVLISEDPNTESLIQYISQKYMIQLTLLGNKRKSKGSGILSSKLLRILKCHVLTIPEGTEPKIERIWVGTDFSKAFKKTLPLLKQISKKLKTVIEVAHVYTIPMQFSPYVSKENMMKKIETHTEKRSKKFFEKTELKDGMEELHILETKDASIAERLLQNASEAGADILVVADKGRNNFSSLLVGSVAEELFNEKPRLPILIVK
ncbi:universal stress protein [Galbibacter sp. EGI 63066]|uniref:universal stress protein n=1 Tax=Galbibacter sp. EGI 63066 TaxID=2993559 RepID=UPI002248F24D|nr:universal stress protein [Galbibacter sp. EGI 63066]MCX2679560.1 universal stress protein [Galbibacter sp. EGI 63066]